MAYSELIKNFNNIREYMREFYVYGFKSREEHHNKSLRTYDNERRRIESYLGEYMRFRTNPQGKEVFISVDSRNIPSNPLYLPFGAKSFTPKDVTFHFYVLDILANKDLSLKEIMDALEQYATYFDTSFNFDESTVRKKLKEYVALGIIEEKKKKRNAIYNVAKDSVHLEEIKDALEFFSQTNPLGVIGWFISSKTKKRAAIFNYKHTYILYAIDSDILLDLLLATLQNAAIDFVFFSKRNRKEYIHTVLPIRIYQSTQGARSYLYCYDLNKNDAMFYRIDSIQKIIKKGAPQVDYEKIKEFCQSREKYYWGVSATHSKTVHHLEMTLFIEDYEEYIYQRLLREKRSGSVVRLDKNHCLFSIDVYDPGEMLPWIRTFTGRIQNLQCTDKNMLRTFFSDIEEMRRLYKGEENAIQ